MSRLEVLGLGIVLVFAYHGIQRLLFFYVLDSERIYRDYGETAWRYAYDLAALVMPLILCLVTPKRSGLVLGNWRGHWRRTVGVCMVPVVATAIVYPYTSQPFTGGTAGGWLISPLAQDLLFAGYIYGLIGKTFTGSIDRRGIINSAVVVTALLFSLWHTPNFSGIAPAYVTFQLLYTFAFYNLMLLPRRWTGSILPVVITHMAVNFLAWMGW